MEPHHFFTEQRVLIVAGKGGVGKSTVAAALAILAARSGLRTLLVSLDAPSVEVPQQTSLETLTVTPGGALTDYLSSKGMGLLSRQLARSGIVELVATTAPGLDDLLVLGRIKAFEKENRADVIIIDGPAAGHASDLVRAPQQLKRAISTGPIGQQADEVLQMLADPQRCKLIFVTTPALTPVAETLDVVHTIQSTVNMDVAALVVNKVNAPVPEITNTGADAYVADAYAYVKKRAAAQNDAIALLQSSRTEKTLQIPLSNEQGAELLTTLANELSSAIAELPSGESL